MAYLRSNVGPGEIAALPPTIGATSRAPTIGAEDVGVPIRKTFPMGSDAPIFGQYPTVTESLKSLGIILAISIPAMFVISALHHRDRIKKGL
jgi:hypothetical protein